jgi:dTDP-4-dehydrorhamnose reductase
MKILVTGSKGQLGSELKELSVNYPFYNFTFIDIDELDLTDLERVDEFFSRNPFDVIVNCAAYTAVDKAEAEPVQATLLNSVVPGHLARIAEASGALLVHISTDYVFNGRNYKPYTEEDTLNPLSKYGESKRVGEDVIARDAKRATILRTSWLYSSYSNNFVKTILKKASQTGELNVVYDQVGTPTHAWDLAKLILDLIPEFLKTDRIEIYHYSDEGVTSWYDFALEIVECAGISCVVHPIGTTSYPTPAARPYYSVLNKTRIKQKYGVTIPHWKDSLRDCIRRIEGNEQ